MNDKKRVGGLGGRGLVNDFMYLKNATLNTALSIDSQARGKTGEDHYTHIFIRLLLLSHTKPTPHQPPPHSPKET